MKPTVFQLLSKKLSGPGSGDPGLRWFCCFLCFPRVYSFVYLCVCSWMFWVASEIATPRKYTCAGGSHTWCSLSAASCSRVRLSWGQYLRVWLSSSRRGILESNSLVLPWIIIVKIPCSLRLPLTCVFLCHQGSGAEYVFSWSGATVGNRSFLESCFHLVMDIRTV